MNWLRLQELWWEPSTKIAVGIAVVAIILVMAFAAGMIPDPMNSRGLGPEWECDALKGAVVCARDVKPPPTPRRQDASYVRALLFIGAIVFVTVFPIGVPVAVWWGFKRYPKVTAFSPLTFVLAVVLAALTFHHFFPQCAFGGRLSIHCGSN